MSGDCRKEGLKNLDKREIAKAVKNVMGFFSVAKCVNGTSAKLKSTNLMVKASGKRGSSVFSEFWSSVEDFEQERSASNCVIVSCICSVKNINQCAKACEHSFLIISADDMNCKDFCKQLGKVMLEPKATIFIETTGLNKEGANRLASFTKSVSNLFDSRIRMVLFSPGAETPVLQSTAESTTIKSTPS